MNTDQLMTKARHALLTGQPNLAALYMRKALQQTDDQRRSLNPLGWQCRKLSEGFQQLGRELNTFAEQITSAISEFAKWFGQVTDGETPKSDFVLVGPGK